MVTPELVTSSARITGRQWYDLFSRGARDWLRHNDKVRESVRDSSPISSPDLTS